MHIEQKKREVLAAEQAWLQAHLALDLAVLDTLMHPDYTIIWPSGRVVEKAEALASYTSGERHWDEAGIHELDVRIYDDIAVVNGLWKANGVNRGVPFDYQARYTSVWIQQEGRWRMLVDRSKVIKA